LGFFCTVDNLGKHIYKKSDLVADKSNNGFC
jgi:hypothetical protein